MHLTCSLGFEGRDGGDDFVIAVVIIVVIGGVVRKISYCFMLWSFIYKGKK